MSVGSLRLFSEEDSHVLSMSSSVSRLSDEAEFATLVEFCGLTFGPAEPPAAEIASGGRSFEVRAYNAVRIEPAIPDIRIREFGEALVRIAEKTSTSADLVYFYDHTKGGDGLIRRLP